MARFDTSIMGNGIKAIIGALLILLTTACGQLQVDDTCECGFYTRQSGEIMAWPDGTNLNFDVASDMPADYKPAIVAITDTYNSLLSKVKLSVHTGPSRLKPFAGSVSDVSGDGTNGVYWVKGEWPWAKSNPDSDAMTVVVFSSDHITEADVFFRAESFPERSTSSLSADGLDGGIPSIGSSKVEAQWIYVIGLHEFGHALGRVHSHEHESLMYPAIGLNFALEPFSEYDVEKFEQVYKVRARDDGTIHLADYGPARGY